MSRPSFAYRHVFIDFSNVVFGIDSNRFALDVRGLLDVLSINVKLCARGVRAVVGSRSLQGYESCFSELGFSVKVVTDTQKETYVDDLLVGAITNEHLSMMLAKRRKNEVTFVIVCPVMEILTIAVQISEQQLSVR
jgi:hypothetical protein